MLGALAVPAGRRDAGAGRGSPQRVRRGALRRVPHEAGCEYSRVRESFEIKVLWELPASHGAAAQDDAEWCTLLRNTPPEQLSRRHLFPVPPCPPCVDDPWVVLATVTLPAADAAGTSAAQALIISYRDRRVLLATQRLQTAVLCVP